MKNYCFALALSLALAATTGCVPAPGGAEPRETQESQEPAEKASKTELGEKPVVFDEDPDQKQEFEPEQKQGILVEQKQEEPAQKQSQKQTQKQTQKQQFQK